MEEFIFERVIYPVVDCFDTLPSIQSTLCHRHYFFHNQSTGQKEEGRSAQDGAKLALNGYQCLLYLSGLLLDGSPLFGREGPVLACLGDGDH